MELDKTDKRILGLLQRVGRLSNRELAAKVSLSPSPCWRRLKELESQGFIKGYAAMLDPEALGLGVTAFTHVSLDNHHPATLKEFHGAIMDCPEVLECHMTSGDHDYTLKVIAKDLASYQSFLSQRLMSVKGVRSVNSSFCLKQHKLTTALPIE
ncbi:MAG: Lrp/AsnC family transcriptional regulator [Pseudomonadota bacterium]